MIKETRELLTCKECKGTGKVKDKICPCCLGMGMITVDHVNIDVRD